MRARTGSGISDALHGARVTAEAQDAVPTLLPCPFCGEALTAHIETQGTKWGAITCQSCGAYGPEVRTQYEAWPAWKDSAVEAWNRRHTTTGRWPSSGDFVFVADKELGPDRYVRGQFVGFDGDRAVVVVDGYSASNTFPVAEIFFASRA